MSLIVKNKLCDSCSGRTTLNEMTIGQRKLYICDACLQELQENINNFAKNNFEESKLMRENK